MRTLGRSDERRMQWYRPGLCKVKFITKRSEVTPCGEGGSSQDYCGMRLRRRGIWRYACLKSLPQGTRRRASSIPSRTRLPLKYSFRRTLSILLDAGRSAERKTTDQWHSWISENKFRPWGVSCLQSFGVQRDCLQAKFNHLLGLW